MLIKLLLIDFFKKSSTNNVEKNEAVRSGRSLQRTLSNISSTTVVLNNEQSYLMGNKEELLKELPNEYTDVFESQTCTEDNIFEDGDISAHQEFIFNKVGR